MEKTAKLAQLLKRESVRLGNFVLSSGQRSSHYIDARLTTMHPEGLRLIGQLGHEAIEQHHWDVTAIGGLTLGADPVSYAIAYFSADRARPIRAFTVRKEPKAHGTGQQIEGPFRRGDRCVITEDVITTGASAIKAIEVVRSAGGIVAGVIGVVDREEGGTARIRACDVPIVCLVSVSALLASSERPPTQQADQSA